MYVKVVIILFIIALELCIIPIRRGYDASEVQIGSFQEFLETKVNPIIWYLHDKVIALIKGDSGTGEANQFKHRLLDLNSEFIENDSAGTLFVITGNVQFRHEQHLGDFRLQGRIFALGQKLIQSETVVCGNLISSEKLGHLNIDSVKTQLRQMPAEDQILRKGQTKPFMIVFSNFSKEKMEGFAIEIKATHNQAVDAP